MRSLARSNAWNDASHELAMARLTQACCKARLSRATLWASQLEKFTANVAAKSAKVTEKDMGLCKVATVRPPVDFEGTSFQFLLLKGNAVKAGGDGAKLVVACVLAAFRGTLVKTKSGSTVRAGKPCPGALPVLNTRILRCIQAASVENEPEVFYVKASSPPLILDPANCVLHCR